MPKALTTPAILTKFSSRVDGSLGFGGVTPELSSPEKCALMDLQNKNVTLLIQPVDGVPEGLVDVKGEFDQKSPSQRLRAVLFVQWKHLTDTKQIQISFDAYYKDAVEVFIQTVKDKLPEQHAQF